MKPSEIITRYNAMHGTTISLIKLMEFRDVVRSMMVDSDRPTVYANDLNGILKRAIKVIKQMRASNAGTIKVMITPIALKREKVEKVIIERVKPGVKTVVPVLKGLPEKKPQAVSHKPQAIQKPVALKPTAHSPQPVAKAVSTGSLSGVNYTYYELALGEFQKEFGKVNSDANMMLWGTPGSGKTYKLLKLAKHFADKGVPVLYVANEEYGKSTLDKKLKELNIHDGYKNLTITKILPADLSPYAVIYFDSVNTMKLTPEMVKALDDKYPNKFFILIVQTNKDGSFRGGRDWEHLVDVAGEVVNRKLILHKNRFDSDSVKKEEVEPLKKQVQKISAPKYEPETIIMKVA